MVSRDALRASLAKQVSVSSIYVNRLALVTSTCGVRELGKLAELTVTPLGQILQAWCSNFLSCAHLPEFFGGTCRKGSQDIVETLL